ncbi:hypothetical protein CRE_30493 [Caenorhabditis remanei]|uniref:Uncharacterized protein n=1 Tax=Caenorhabditis remanei TaxID=31234 RepID=E3NI63_CAERE|nr:hypothetical protein CRE_30493 [Caenorhabditis remanei]
MYSTGHLEFATISINFQNLSFATVIACERLSFNIACFWNKNDPRSRDPAHQYYNATSKIQYLHLTFDEHDALTRSRDSAIFEESYHPNYIQSHPLYSNIFVKKNMGVEMNRKAEKAY